MQKASGLKYIFPLKQNTSLKISARKSQEDAKTLSRMGSGNDVGALCPYGHELDVVKWVGTNGWWKCPVCVYPDQFLEEQIPGVIPGPMPTERTTPATKRSPAK
eukprot:g11593.t1